MSEPLIIRGPNVVYKGKDGIVSLHAGDELPADAPKETVDAVRQQEADRLEALRALGLPDDDGDVPAGSKDQPVSVPQGDGTGGAGGDEDLSKASREDLDNLALNLGVEEPAKLPNKGEVIKAIEAKRAENA